MIVQKLVNMRSKTTKIFMIKMLEMGTRSEKVVNGKGTNAVRTVGSTPLGISSSRTFLLYG